MCVCMCVCACVCVCLCACLCVCVCEGGEVGVDGWVEWWCDSMIGYSVRLQNKKIIVMVCLQFYVSVIASYGII